MSHKTCVIILKCILANFLPQAVRRCDQIWGNPPRRCFYQNFDFLFIYLVLMMSKDQVLKV